MTIREKIVECMNSKDYRPMDKNELAKIFGIDKKGRKVFWTILEELEKEGQIIRLNDEKYTIVDDEVFIYGTLEGNNKGFGFVVPEEKDRADIFIPIDNLNGAMHGDKVLANIVKASTESRREEGEIVKILERKNLKIVGTYQESRNFGFVVPDEDKINYDIFIPKAFKGKAKNNQKVVVEIDRWPRRDRNPEGKIVEILGFMWEKGTDILSVIRQYDLPEEFPDKVQAYVSDIYQGVPKKDIEHRRDLRDLKTVTIDGFDAKDLDDAISIKKLEDGSYDLGVHIADVSHYVPENSILDEEALSRGNSVYLLDRVIPMLPKELSNGICSLNPGEDRLCLSVLMNISSSGEVLKHEIVESVINSDRRLVYDDVSDFLEHDSEEAKKKLDGVLEELTYMKELAKILYGRRERRGSIDFDFPETTIILDDEGVPVEIRKEERRISNRIIEEFMLVCNETVSEQFYWAEIPFLYRIHEEPSQERIEEFSRILFNFGYTLKGKEDIHPKELQMLTKKIKGKKEETLISTLLLRSLKKAEYSDVSRIHFGLAADYYSHFTAPIRRYPDLVIHRIIKEFINGRINSSKISSLEKKLPDIAKHTSMTERRAEEAEREVEDMKKAQYMVPYIGEEFDGIISSLTRFGIFVELDNTIEGLIHFTRMTDDYYEFDEKNYYVIGEKTKKTYRLGDKVRIKVLDADVMKRAVDFVFV